MPTEARPSPPDEGELLPGRPAGKSRLHLVNRISAWIDRMEAVSKAAMAVLVMGLGAVMTLQVVNRYSLQMAFPWTQEVALLCLVWMSFIGASVAVRHHAHFTVMLLQDILPSSWWRGVNLIVYLLMLVLSSVLLLYGIAFAEMGVGRLSSAMQVRMIWFYLAIPVSALLMTVYLVERIVIEGFPAASNGPKTS